MHKLLALLLLINLSCHAELYKSIGADGTVTYSDTPQGNATPVDPPELQTTPAVTVPPKPKAVEDTSEKPQPYKTFKIASPENDATIHDNNGNITVTLTIEPALQTAFKHQVQFLLDSKVITTQASNSFTHKNIDRGTHTVSARIIDEKGKTLKSSSAHTVYLKRHSILHKQSNSVWPQTVFPKSIKPANTSSTDTTSNTNAPE